MPKRDHDESCRELCDELRHLRHEINELKDSIMIAQTTLDASIAGLTGAVNAAVLALQAGNTATSTPDAVVAAYVAGVDAQTVALSAATPPAPTSAPAK